MPLKILQQNHTCPNCGHTWSSTKPINTDDWDMVDEDLRVPLVRGGSYGAGIGAGCATVLILLTLFHLILRAVLWFFGVDINP